MKKNEHQIDRIVRVFIGLVVLGLGVYFQNWLGVFGFIPLASGIAGFCPLYHVLGFSNCPLKFRG